MDNEAERAAQRALEPGERLLWSGRPGRRLSPDALRIGVVALGVTAFASALAVTQWLNPAALLVAFAGAVGVLGVFVAYPHDQARLRYAVTDRRVLIVHQAFGRRVEEYPLADMTEGNVQLVPDARSPGVGTLRFADFAYSCGDDDVCMPTFAAITESDRIAALVRDAIAEAPRPELRLVDGVVVRVWVRTGDRSRVGATLVTER